MAGRRKQPMSPGGHPADLRPSVHTIPPGSRLPCMLDLVPQEGWPVLEAGLGSETGP